MNIRPIVFGGGEAAWLLGLILAITACVMWATRSGAWGFTAFLISFFLLMLISGATQKIMMEVRAGRQES